MGKRRRKRKGGGQDVIGSIVLLFFVAYFWQPILYLAAIGVAIWVLYTVIKHLQPSISGPTAAPTPLPRMRDVPAALPPEPLQADMDRCDRCKTWLPAAARFCRRCGQPKAA